MDFHSLARRDLQALCKLNAVPANITNVAMADALKSLDIVEGLEDFLNRSPERKAVTAAKVPRTGRRTGNQSKPIGDVSESVQPMTKSTRRTTRRAISDEIMQESKMTPAIRSSRKMVEFAKTESEGTEDVEKIGVTDTPDLATYSRRSQVARKSSVKEVSTVQKVYSTRKSARLTENKDGEVKEEKIDSLVTELSRIDLGDCSDNKNLSGNDAEVVSQESVEKSDVVALETANNLEDNEALDEVNAVQEDSSKSLVIENEKQGDVQEETVEELVEESKQLDESPFVANSEVINDEDKKVPGYPINSGNSHEQTKPDEAAPKSGMEVVEDDAKEIVVDKLKEKSEQCFDTLDGSHFVREVNANSVMIEEDEDCKVEKSLMGSDNPHEQLNLEAGEESETNMNLESVVLAIAELSAGGDSYMTISDESKDILDNNDAKENADQTEDEMDSEKSFLDEVEPSIADTGLRHHVTCFEESKSDVLNNDYPKEIATGIEVAPFLSSGGAENKPVTKTPSVKGSHDSDDKENINGNGIKFEPTAEEAKENINGNGIKFEPTAEEAKKNKKNELHEKSLRELTKLLKEKLRISNNTAEEIGKVTKERPALQKLEDNCQR